MAPWCGNELALTRAAAARHQIQIVRAGHGLLEAITEHLQRTDRGIAFAFWRPATGIWPPMPLLRTDFLVRAGENARLRDVAAADGMASWLTATIEAAMPPVVEGVVVGLDGAEMTDAEAMRPFQPHARRPQSDVGPRALCGADRAPRLGAQSVQEALRYARVVLLQRSTFAEAPAVAAAAVSEAVEDRLTVLRARVAAGHSGAATQCAGLERLASAVPERLDVVDGVLGCGVMLRGDPVRMRSAGA